MTPDNPLLKDSPLKHKALPFSEIHSSHFLPALDQAIKEAQLEIEKIKTNPEPPHFTNTIEALEMSGDNLNRVSKVFYSMLYAHTNDELQKLAGDFGPKLSAHSSDILLDAKLFARIETVYKNCENKDLNAEQTQLLKDSYDGFVRNGARLNKNEQERLRQVDQRLSQLSPIFSENVLKATNAFQLHIPHKDEPDLKGLPELVVEAAALTAQENKKKGWIFTLHAPSLIPFLKYADNRPLREKLWKAYASRGLGEHTNNRDVVLETVRLRHERANLLGFDNHAQYSLKKKMAETPDKVMSFLETLLTASKKSWEKELKSLREIATTDGVNEIQPWDISYYSEKLKKSLFNFDEEEIRPYFPLNNVIQGAFIHAQKLYGLTFSKTDDYPTYHKDVITYEVHDEKSKEFVGLFYGDFFPRDSKSGGAWKTSFYDQGYFKGELIRPHVSIVCNFTKPTGKKTSLLTFMEVQTLFHEFGHALHALLSKCHYCSLSGTKVLWDFVELPSQIMENWTLEKEGLNLFAKHYETGEKIPDELIEKLKKNDQFMAGYNCLRQVNFALLDMFWHTKDPKDIESVEEFELKAIERSSPLPPVKLTNISCAFGHIFAGGYAAGYYGYHWAEGLDADAFEVFQKEGLFNPDTAHRFRSCILEKGGTEPPMKLYKDFRGRKPDPTALLRRKGFL